MTTDVNNPPASAFPFLAASSGATLSATDTAEGLGLKKSANAAGGDNSVVLAKPVPSGNWVATARLRHSLRGLTDRARHGFCIHEASTGKTIFIGMDSGATSRDSISVYYFSDLSTFGSGLFNSPSLGETPAGDGWPEWFRISYNGTQYSFEVSYDGRITWTLCATALASSFFTADKVGFFLNNFSTVTFPEAMIVPFYDDGDPFPGTSPHYLVSSVAAETLSSGDGSNAQTSTAAAEIISSGAGSKAQVANVAAMVLYTVAAQPARAFDGTKIYEFGFAFQPETIYNESDWDSIWSIGDRVGNGLLTASQAGWGTTFGSVDDLFNANYAFAAGDGFQVNGNGDGWPFGAYWGWRTRDDVGLSEPPQLFISGIRFNGNSASNGDGLWSLWAGYHNQPWMVATLEFNEFNIAISTANPLGGTLQEMNFTPPFQPFDSWFLILAGQNDADPNFGSCNMGAELELKVYHSVLDGGDRRATNGRSIKRVTMSTSSGITPSAGVGVDPLSIAFDGKYAFVNRGSSTKTQPMSLQKTGASSPWLLDVPGQWVQFSFPRKVFMREMVWNTDTAEVMSGTDPTVYGLWQWQASNAPTTGFVNVGGPWHFAPGSTWVRSPKPIDENAQDFTPYLYPYWRMVLVEGPAFGDVSIYQIQFNLIDPDNQSPLYEAAFTDDDSDAFSGTLTLVAPGSAFEAAFTDSDDDKLNGDISILTNFILTAAFTDGDSDALIASGSFYPSVFSQVIVNVKGK